MGKLKPALLGALATAALSIMFSRVPLVKMTCCLWAIGGGFLAAFLYFREEGKINIQEGTLVGLFAGLIAGVLAGAVDVILIIMIGAMDQAMQQMQSQMQFSAMSGVVYVRFFMYLIVLSVFCLIGGVIGAAVFQNQGKDQKAAQAKKVN